MSLYGDHSLIADGPSDHSLIPDGPGDHSLIADGPGDHNLIADGPVWWPQPYTHHEYLLPVLRQTHHNQYMIFNQMDIGVCLHTKLSQVIILHLITSSYNPETGVIYYQLLND